MNLLDKFSILKNPLIKNIPRKAFVQYNTLADTRSLYIHWPFCPYRCHFCPFVALSGQDHLMGQYHEALMQEIEKFAQSCDRKLPLETIYIGGGTPSTWPDQLLLDMSGRLRSMFDLRGVTEMTLEVNPGTVRKEQLAVWKEAGVTRISIGVQSLNDEVLKKLNRHQKAEDVFRLLEWSKGVFNSVSVDLIIGFPGISTQEWKAMIEIVVTWPIQHISMYFLSIHENTPLYYRLQKNEFSLPPEDPIVDLYYWTVEKFAQNGLLQYEISSFARTGYEAHHNQVYWDHKPYKGFGIGSCSFDGIARSQNQKNVMRYMESVQNGESVEVLSELLTVPQIRLEKVMLGLRRMKGLLLEEIFVTQSPEEQEKFMQRVTEFEKEKILRSDGRKIYLEAAFLAVENEVAVRLLQ